MGQHMGNGACLLVWIDGGDLKRAGGCSVQLLIDKTQYQSINTTDIYDSDLSLEIRTQQAIRAETQHTLAIS